MQFPLLTAPLSSQGPMHFRYLDSNFTIAIIAISILSLSTSDEIYNNNNRTKSIQGKTAKDAVMIWIHLYVIRHWCCMSQQPLCTADTTADTTQHSPSHNAVPVGAGLHLGWPSPQRAAVHSRWHAFAGLTA